MVFRAVTFGEVMGRIAPPGFLRFSQALPGSMDITFAGAEANVAVSLAMLGANVSFVTALPENPIAEACINTLRGRGVNTSSIYRTGFGRLGLYFVETGANQRGGNVIYDRDGSSIMLAPPETYDWQTILEGTTWFHITGITPSLSKNAALASLAAVKTAKKKGATVSCDLNYRKKLWKWEAGTKQRDLAERTMREMLSFVDVVVANEEDAELVLGIKAEGTDVEAGRLNVDGYKRVAATLVEQFPNVSHVAVTLRESISASYNNWGGLLYTAGEDRIDFAPVNVEGVYSPYEIRNIVDRVGGGDSFSAGLIFALNTPELAGPETAIRFAVAASCLKHSILGDFNYVTRDEIESLMKGQASGRVKR